MEREGLPQASNRPRTPLERAAEVADKAPTLAARGYVLPPQRICPRTSPGGY